MSEEITITIKLQSQEEFPLTVTLQTKVSEVKEKCIEKAGIPVEDIRLIFKGRILKNEQTLEEYKIAAGVTVHLVQSSESKTSTEAEAPKTDAPVGLGAPPTAAAAGLGAIPGLVPGQMPDAAQIGEVLKNPKVQEMMSDPSFIQDMMEQNPFLKQMAEANPMMKQMLSNPEMMKEMMNPDSIMSALSMMGGMGGMPGMPGMPGMGMGGMPGMPGMPGMGGMGGMPGMPGMGGFPGMPGMPGMGGMGGFPGMPGMGGMGMPGMPGMGGFPGMGPMGMMGMNPMMMGMNPMMMGMMGGGGNPFAGAKPQHDMSKPPKERYAEEIGMLGMMGITDQDAICKALEESNGDLDLAMEKLAPLLDYGDEDDKKE